MYHRVLNLALDPGQSAFIWGPRKCGKSTFLREAYPGALYLDLLDSRLQFDLLRAPWQLEGLIDAALPEQRQLPIIIDEVQKVPVLLEEVHRLIESRHFAFVMTASSARKLLRGNANLLGGRAIRFRMFPLVSAEIPNFDLLRALNNGLIPSHYDSTRPDRPLSAYVDDFLKEEIAAEALTRNLAAFARFLDVMGIANGQIVNYANIASDVGVDGKTVRAYFEILGDTLIGRFLDPFSSKTGSRKLLSSAPKFYLFDTGLVRFLRRITLTGLRGPEAGHLFETFIAHEIFANISYRETRIPVNYYRTKAGSEVDFILDGGATAIEAKLSTDIRSADLRGLNSFLDDHPDARAIVVCLEQRKRIVEAHGRKIEITPWPEFCRALWAGEI